MSDAEDAARYRFLRDMNWSDDMLVVAESNALQPGSMTYSGGRLDEIIDKLRSAGKASERTP